MRGIHHFDEKKGTLDFTCPFCDVQGTHDVKKGTLHRPHKTERAVWSLTIRCTECESKGQVTDHHINCNLPNDHPHAEHINKALKHLGALDDGYNPT